MPRSVARESAAITSAVRTLWSRSGTTPTPHSIDHPIGVARSGLAEGMGSRHGENSRLPMSVFAPSLRLSANRRSERCTQ